MGTTPDWFDLVQRPLIAGRRLIPRDLKARANSVVLTEYGARRLLATEESIGQSLRLGGQYFEVVGIIKSESGQSGTVRVTESNDSITLRQSQ